MISSPRHLPLLCFAAFAAVPLTGFSKPANVVVEPVAGFETPTDAKPAGEFSQLVRGSDGGWYGTSSKGGLSGKGSVFRISPSGTLQVIHSFSGEAIPQADAQPAPCLLAAPDGSFYGANNSLEGSPTGIFRITPRGAFTRLEVLNHNLNWLSTESLTMGSDGSVYGIASLILSSDSLNHTDIFRLSPDGTFASVARFNSNSPWGAPYLVRPGQDGSLYAIAGQPGDQVKSSFLRIAPDGAITPLFEFPQGPNSFVWNLISGPDGNFYGSLLSDAGGSIFRITTSGEFTTLVSFNGPNGSDPEGTLSFDAEGNLYGTTYSGGTNNRGVAFRIDPAGTFSKIADLTADTACIHGVAAGPDGEFFGISDASSGHPNQFFRIDAAGQSTSILNFDHLPTPPSTPQIMIRGNDGHLYGVCGGDQSALSFFTIDSGEIHILASGPTGYALGLAQAADGSLICVTNSQVVKVAMTGTTTAIAPLPISSSISVLGLISADGGIYGLSSTGGSHNAGFFFRLEENGAVSNLADFPSQVSMPVRGSDGFFYGTASSGGAHNDGYAYRVSTSGDLTILADFDRTTVGAAPQGGLALRSDGNFYGVASYRQPGFSNGLFKLTPSGSLTSVLIPEYVPWTVSSLYTGPDGNCYGVAPNDIFRLTEDGHYSLIYHFEHDTGSNPLDTLALGDGGSLYGVALSGGLTPEGIAGEGGEIFRVRFVDGPSPFEALLAGAGSNSGPLDDADGDGINNLMEYAFGTSPLVAGSNQSINRAAAGVSGLPILGQVTDYNFPGLPNRGIFARRKDRAASGLDYQPQYSSDMIHWIDIMDQQEVMPQLIDSDAEMELLSVPIPSDYQIDPETQEVLGMVPRFFRVVVSAP